MDRNSIHNTITGVVASVLAFGALWLRRLKCSARDHLNTINNSIFQKISHFLGVDFGERNRRLEDSKLQFDFENRRNSEETPNSKSKQLEKLEPSWSELSCDFVECIIGHLCWIDRLRIRAVCKAWSVPNRYIPPIDSIPWALKKLTWKSTEDGRIYGDCRLLDPLSREYVVKESFGGEEFYFLPDAIPCASAYGWVLFKTSYKLSTISSYFLYSPFTTEVISLPKLWESTTSVAAISLNATSPKCVVFLLCIDKVTCQIRVNLCSPGDSSWKKFEFSNGLDRLNVAVNAVYANGVVYCLFRGRHLGAFNVELKEWTMLFDKPMQARRCYKCPKLIVFDADLLMLETTDAEDLLTLKYSKLFKFDFSELRWVLEKNLNNRVLFIGCTSFSAPVVGERSQLANTIFDCNQPTRYFARCYGSRSPSNSGSLLYSKCVEAAKCGMTWVQVPSGGIWRANDLINAA